MRIITGKYRGANIFSLRGKTTRPTTGFIREAIFSKLFDLSGCEVLDLFAGSGSFGFEALSRGAKSAHFVEGSHKAVQIIKKNISKLQVSKESVISKKRVERFIKSCDEQYDIIFMDPPYDKNLINKSIKLVLEHNLLKPDGQLIIERYSREKISASFAARVVSDKDYKSTAVTIIK